MAAADACGRCKQGYYLTKEGYCRKNPAPPIAGCRKYRSNEICAECEDGFMLEGGNCANKIG